MSLSSQGVFYLLLAFIVRNCPRRIDGGKFLFTNGKAELSRQYIFCTKICSRGKKISEKENLYALNLKMVLFDNLMMKLDH